MQRYAWLFPIIFIFHDMEEIIGLGAWLRKNLTLIQEKYPFFLRTYKDFSTEGFALAVAEELVLCIALSAAALYTDSELIWYLWLGAFIGCDLHFLIHIGQSLIIRKYIPALLTSIICLPVSTYVIYRSVCELPCDMPFMAVTALAGCIMVGVNLRAAQKLIGWFTRKMELPPLI